MEVFGSFQGDVKSVWLTQPTNRHRVMELIEPLTFHRMGKDWTAQPGERVDGAIIPPALWSTVGSPFVGNYRRASVLHDVYCQRKTETWQETHWMFVYTMRTDGECWVKAWNMFMAVWNFGPQWPQPNPRHMTLADIDAIESACNGVLAELGEDVNPIVVHERVQSLLNDGTAP